MMGMGGYSFCKYEMSFVLGFPRALTEGELEKIRDFVDLAAGEVQVKADELLFPDSDGEDENCVLYEYGPYIDEWNGT